jgi:predicted DNA-binding protein (UPF0251 family)
MRGNEVPKAEREPAVLDELDMDATVKEGLGILKAADLDTSGFEKGRREAVRLAQKNRTIDAQQKATAMQLRTARRTHDETRNALARFALSAVPPELRAAEVEAARRVNALEVDFHAGAAQLQTSGEALDTARAAARNALAGALVTHVKKLGAQIRPLLEQDGAFLLERPQETPAEVLDLHRHAMVAAALADRLDGRVGRAYLHFEKAAGEIVMEILTDAVRLGRPMQAFSSRLAVM